MAVGDIPSVYPNPGVRDIDPLVQRLDGLEGAVHVLRRHLLYTRDIVLGLQERGIDATKPNDPPAEAELMLSLPVAWWQQLLEFIDEVRLRDRDKYLIPIGYHTLNKQFDARMRAREAQEQAKAKAEAETWQ